jgi:hypothetical protein
LLHRLCGLTLVADVVSASPRHAATDLGHEAKLLSMSETTARFSAANLRKLYGLRLNTCRRVWDPRNARTAVRGVIRRALGLDVFRNDMNIEMQRNLANSS